MKKTIDALKWRYATKEFGLKKLPAAKLNSILEALRLSPSSYGLQPWKFVVVTNPEIRTKLRAFAWNQSQVTDASHLIVLCLRKGVDEAYVDKYIASIAKIRGMKPDDLAGFANLMKGHIKALTPEQVDQWSTRQIYIALGVAMTVAAQNGIDTCPMEGFDPKKFDEVLGLAKQGLESKVLLAIGYRSKTDKTASYKKARFSKEEVIVEVN